MNLYDFVNKSTKEEIDISLWKDFQVSKYFSIERPVARTSISYDEGSTPFVASGNFNNGVEKYVQPKDEILDKGNCLTVSPVDGSTFYQKNDFLGRGGAGSSILLLRNENLNQWNALFICSVLRKVCSKYNYSNMCSAEKLKKEILYLPMTKNNEPDWDYMEKYSKNIYMDIQKYIKNINE